MSDLDLIRAYRTVGTEMAQVQAVRIGNEWTVTLDASPDIRQIWTTTTPMTDAEIRLDAWAKQVAARRAN